MGFNALYALWLLPLLGLIILMYLLKEEHEDLEVPSLYLWKTVMADSEVKKPWQKLKNNILMILQLLAAFLIITALANPFIKSGKTVAGDIIIVIDNSGSMNALAEDKTRFETAKSMAEKVIREAPTNSSFTIISANRDAKVEINTKDKTEAISKIKSIKPGNMKGNISNHSSIIKAIYNQYNDATILAYTDEYFSLEDMKGEIINLGGSDGNIGITNISYSEEGDSYTVLVKVQKTAGDSFKNELVLYGEDELIGLKEIELSDDNSINIYFHNVRKDYDYLKAELSYEDTLMADNEAYLVLQSPKPKKVLFISKGNVFFEKSLSVINGIELYKTDKTNVIDTSYDLYIYDGKMPDELPKGSSLLLINPDKYDGIFEPEDDLGSNIAHFENNPINKHIEKSDFFINKAKTIKKPIWADALITSGDKTLGGIGELEGRKVAYITFDIRDSDLPLSPAFPMFIYNITSYLVDLETKGKGFYQSGETIDLLFSPDIKDVQIVKPSGEKEILRDDILSFGFNNTDETGIYKLDYKKDDGKYQKLFAVNFPYDESLNAFSKWSGENDSATATKNFKTASDMQRPLIIIVFLILLGEWAVFIRGN